jgi:Mg-chelatase subunit ChlD
MTSLTFLVKISLLLVATVSMVAAQTEPFRIRSVFVNPSGELSAIVDFPPGTTPKSTDFHLLIDDRRVATARETQDQRLALMFLVDVSGSMKGPPLNDVKSALPAFLSKTRPQDQFALTFFADEDRVMSSFEEPRDKINDALRNARAEGKRTKLYQALYNTLRQGFKDDPQTRRIIVVLSDGRDEGSDVTLSQVITESRARLVPIYAVFRGEIEQSFADVLSGLANAAGGNFFSTRSRNEIASALDQIYRLETNSVAVRFVYKADRTGRATQNAAIELQRPAGPPLRATLRETIPALALTPPPTDGPGTEPSKESPWWRKWRIALLLVPLIALVGGGLFWLWRRTQKTPAGPVTPLPVEPVPVDVPAPAPTPRRRETVIIGQHFPAPASGRPAVLLRGISGPAAGREHFMEREIFSIGADAQSDLLIADDEYVSREHACLRYEQGNLFIFDKASRNGTFVNDSKVPENGMALRPDDRITLGLSTFLVVMPAR